MLLYGAVARDPQLLEKEPHNLFTFPMRPILYMVAKKKNEILTGNGSSFSFILLCLVKVNTFKQDDTIIVHLNCCEEKRKVNRKWVLFIKLYMSTYPNAATKFPNFPQPKLVKVPDSPLGSVWVRSLCDKLTSQDTTYVSIFNKLMITRNTQL